MNDYMLKYYGLNSSEEYGEMCELLRQNAPCEVPQSEIDRDYDGDPDGNFSPVRRAWEGA